MRASLRTTGKNKKMKPAVETVQRSRSAPLLEQRAPEMQAYGKRYSLPIGLPDKVCEASIALLNQVLADTMAIRDLYKKHHWQVSGPTFYQLHLLLDKHYEEQSALIDELAERIQMLGGISISMAQDVAEMTRIERPPRGREEVPVQISRLLEAHEIILTEAREATDRTGELGDVGSQDLLISRVIRQNEMQVWFLSEHLVRTPIVASHSHGAKQ